MIGYRQLKVLAAATVVVLLAVGCGDSAHGDSNDGESVDRYQILDWNPDDQRYETMESTIQTLTDRPAVNGDIAELRGGGQIRAATSEPQTREEFENAIRIDDDQTPRARYEIIDGVVKGWDYESFLMFTLYHHLERSMLYFESIGVDREVVGRMPVYYSPELRVGFIPFNLLTDNAAYAFTLDAFLIPPQFLLEDLPLSANRGVIVHEYSHAVFNRLVHGDQRVPDYLYEPWDDEYANRISSLDEGIADIFGALAVEDPNFISASISEDLFDVDRDLAVDREYTASLQDALTQSTNSYNPYKLGSVIASTIWAIRPIIDDDEQLGRALASALEDFAEVEPSFTLADFFNRLHDQLPQQATDDACDVFVERLTAISGELTCAQ